MSTSKECARRGKWRRRRFAHEREAMTIPKKLHIIWIGDESRRPDEWIQTWKDNHPTWEFKLWGNAEYDSAPWRCKKQMDILRAAKVWEGVADIMRYEILFRHGGVYVDADSTCVRPLDDKLLDNKMFVPYASERSLPGIITNCFIGSIAEHPVLGSMIEKIYKIKESETYRWGFYRWKLQRRPAPAWELVGPLLLTEAINKYPELVRVYPSIMFIPKHFTDKEERINNDPDRPTYARHMYATTQKAYPADLLTRTGS